MIECDKVSETVVRRLPKYYRYLTDLLNEGVRRISSRELSSLTGFTASQIRQDLNNFGGFGQQGYGYNVEELKEKLGKILGIDRGYKTIIIGSGNLGQALANYNGFRDSGYELVQMFDKNPNIVGKEVRGMIVKHIDELENYVKENNIEIGIITTPKSGAQWVADILDDNGVKGIWNFAPVDLKVSDHIVVENVHLNESLFTLSYFLHNAKVCGRI